MSDINKKRKFWLCRALLLITLVFFAQSCSLKKHIVKFDTDGGSKIEDVKVKDNKKVEKPTNPTKEGFVFDGWYYNDEKFDFNTKITKDITLKAHWEDIIGVRNKTMKILLNTKNQYKVEIISLPNGVKMSDLQFSSSNEEIVTVDEKGNLTPVALGEVEILVQTSDGKYSTKVTITITQKEIPVESFFIEGWTTIAVGETATLYINPTPSNATTTNTTWTSSDTSIVVINGSGTMTGLREGTVTITAETENGKTATYTVTVYVNGKVNNAVPVPSTPTTPSEPTPSEQEPNPTPETPTPSEGETPTPEPDPTPDPIPDPEPEPDPEPTPDPEPEPDPTPEPETDTEPEQEEGNNA